MSYYNLNQGMPSSSARVGNGNQNIENFSNYDPQDALFQIQGNSMHSSGTGPYGHNVFSYQNNVHGAQSSIQGQTMVYEDQYHVRSHSVNEHGLSYMWSTTNSHSGFLNNNGDPSTIMGNSGSSFPIGYPSNIIGNPNNVWVNPDPSNDMTSQTFTRGNIVNNTRESNRFHPISFAGRVRTNLRATPPSFSDTERVEMTNRQSWRNDRYMWRQPTSMDVARKNLTEKERMRKLLTPTFNTKPALPMPREMMSSHNRAPRVNTNAHDWEDDEVVILTKSQFEFNIGCKQGPQIPIHRPSFEPCAIEKYDDAMAEQLVKEKAIGKRKSRVEKSEMENVIQGSSMCKNDEEDNDPLNNLTTKELLSLAIKRRG